MMKKNFVALVIAVTTAVVIAACIDGVPANPFLNIPTEPEKKRKHTILHAQIPLIFSHPQNTVYGHYDMTAALTVGAEVEDGGLLTYQWYGDDSIIDGATEASYAPPTDTVGTAYYYVVITNTIADNGDGGNKIASIHSDTAEVTVEPFALSFSSAVLTPLTGENSIAVTVIGLLNTPDTVTISVTNLPAAGIYFNTGVNTIAYDGTTAFANPSVTLNFSVSVGSEDIGSIPMTITVYDGQANYTGAAGTYDRRIPVRQANIAAFNSYAGNLPNRHFKLMENIALSGTNNWTRIGNTSRNFTGSFDGQGHTITGLNINRTTEDYQGMFGYIASGGIVQNVGLVGGSVSGKEYVGGVAGYNNYGSIVDCSTTGSVNGSDYYVGGVVGYNTGVVFYCYATGNVSGSNGRVGGVVGHNTSSVFYCYATGNVSVYLDAGGVVGYNTGTVQDCYATGNVSSEGNNGGVVGYNNSDGTVQNCYATGNVNASVNNVGGVVGMNFYRVRNCVALNSRVTGNTSNPNEFGRVVGRSDFTNSSLANIYARNSGMTITNRGATYTPTSNLNGKDGLSTSAYNTQSFWTTASNWYNNTAWNFTSVWEWNSTTRLPILRNMPGNRAQNHTVP